MLEKTIEKRLREAIKKVGGRAYKFLSPGVSGVPDRIVILPGGRIYFVELKAAGRKPTKLQEVQMSRLRELGCEVRVVTGICGLEKFLEEVEA